MKGEYSPTSPLSPLSVFRFLGALMAILFWVAGLATAENPVYSSAVATQPLRLGATVPSVTVRAVDGSSVDLANLVKHRGALLVFYRGGW